MTADDWKSLLFFFFIIVLPILQRISEAAAKRRKARQAEPTAPTARELLGEVLEDDEEPLPEWYDASFEDSVDDSFRDDEEWEESPPEEPVLPAERAPQPAPPVRVESPLRLSSIAPLLPGGQEPMEALTASSPWDERRDRSQNAFRQRRKGRSGPRTNGLSRLQARSELQKAILYAELLAPPRALRPYSDED